MKNGLVLLLAGAVCILFSAGLFSTNLLHSRSLFPDNTPTPPRTSESPSGRSFDTVRTNLHDYIWPTDASTKITSTFAEYRSSHFHGGIDISTNGQTGYHVFAVREGYIYRVKIMPDGYGKMLFVKHPDGYVSTYAHLGGFNSSIARVVRQEQYRRGSFSVDMVLDPNTLPVKKGDIIAYTGDSGVGPPHLHFELRDENLNPVNPLLLSNYKMADDIPPVITRMMISPLRYNSSVENSASPHFFSRFPRRGHTFVNPQRVRVEGEIGFAVDAIDRANNTYTHSGIHRLEFYFDDSLVYVMQLDRVPDEDTKEIDLHYDLPSLTAGTGRFQKLYIDIGNTLPFYDHRPPGSGIINTRTLHDGVHRYRVVCVDFPGNRTELEGEVVVANKPMLKIASVTDREVRLEGPQLASLEKFNVYGKRNGTARWSVHSLSRDRFELHDGAVLLPVNSGQYDVLKIVGETDRGIESPPAFYFVRKPNGGRAEAVLDVDPLRSYTRVTLTTRGAFTAPPNVLVKEGPEVHSVPLEAVDVNKYAGAFNPSDIAEGNREIDATVEVNGVVQHLNKTFQLYAIPPDRSGSFSVEYGSMVVSFDSGAVYQPLYLKVSREYYDGNPIYALDPVDVLLRGGLRISLPRPEHSRYQHLGIYYRYNNGWRFQTSQPDSNRQYFTAKLSRRLGEVAVLGDDQPPSIGRFRASASRGIASVGFTYHDNLSGVDPEQIRLYIDNTVAIPEIDEEHHTVWFKGEDPLARGKHRISVRVPDRAGNVSNAERVIAVR